jgi:hypothetical protein
MSDDPIKNIAWGPALRQPAGPEFDWLREQAAKTPDAAVFKGLIPTTTMHDAEGGIWLICWGPQGPIKPSTP